MAGAFSSAFSSAFDVGAAPGGDPLPGLGGALGGGLIGWGRRLQYLALAGPLFLPAAPIAAPDLSDARFELPVRRRFPTQPSYPPEWGRSDPPPPAAPDLVGVGDAPRLLRHTRPIPEPQPPILPPGYPPPEWYPRAPERLVNKSRAVESAFALPPERPTIPFNPEQQAAEYPQPPGPKALLIRLSPVRFVPASPFVPPSVQPLANPVSWWSRWPDGRPPTARPRQYVEAAPQNEVPIPNPAPPELSWAPDAEVPVRRRFIRPGWFSGPLEPLTTPALISSMWQGDPPHVSPAKRFLTALQQAEAAPGPAIEILVNVAPWRGVAPEYLLRLRPQQPEAALLPPNPSIISEGVGCASLVRFAVTYSTLLAPAVTSATLAQPSLRYSTLLQVEVC